MMLANKKNKTILILVLLSLGLSGLYLFYNIRPNIFAFTMKLRTPKYLAIILAAISIGLATYIFQTLVANVVITPSLLGMNSLYTLIKTALVFVLGPSSALFLNKHLSFLTVLIAMVATSLIIYGWLFNKTNHNIFYILLIGTVISTLFTSIQESMVRVMDPNAYDTILNTLVASFNKVDSSLIAISTLLILASLLIFKEEISYLNILILGKNQAINLGVDYDKVSQKLLILVSILIAISTALVGPISFLGLIIVNLARGLIKTYKYSYLILASILIGIILLLGAQFLIEHVFSYSLPISVFINLFGGLYFLVLLAKERGNI